MKAIDNTAKLFLIPENVSDLNLVILSISARKFTLAVCGETIYELKEIGPASHFDKHPELKLPSGEPVKSCIIESFDYNLGSVLSNPLLISLTEFDISYPMIVWMSTQSELRPLRYHSAQDILDGFSVCLADAHQKHLIKSNVFSSLNSFCEQIEENGGSFYKLSPAKLYSHLEKRIQKLITVISENPDYAFSSQVVESISSVSGLVPKEIMELQIINYSINFLFGSFLNLELMQSYLDYKKYDFLPLHAFIADKERQERARTVAEENIGLAGSKSKLKENQSERKSAKISQSRKKLVKKVAVGEGVLDSFFKRQ